MGDVREFLEASNAIEDVHDDDALADSLDAWRYIEAEAALSHDVVQTAHHHILKERQPGVAGHYRDAQVEVGGRTPPAPEFVPRAMDELLAWNPDDPVEAIEWHVAFERIHPFADGNGRVGRLVYLWHCRTELGVEPVLWRAADREGYYSLFDAEITVPAPDDR